MDVIRAERITKKFGDFVALNNVEFKMKKGEILGLLGPNGAGKTTLVKILNGIMKPTSGRVSVLGCDPLERKMRHRIGYMPQETALYLDNTVHENIMFFGELYGLSKDKILKREKELLAFTNLEKWRNVIVANLSGGMRHRLSLACALVHEPELLFLDEPTVGVDPELRTAFWEYFYRMQKDGVSILLTTHYMEEAAKCTMLALMRSGKIIAQGTPADLMSKTSATTLEDVFLKIGKVMER